MQERTSLILRLILTHAAPVIAFGLTAVFLKNDTILLITITQSILLITIFAGYWEFISKKIKWIFFGFAELLILTALYARVINPSPAPLGFYASAAEGIIQIFLLCQVFKITLVILTKEKESLEITFPFGPGVYLVTDGGNSKISRMMNYHYHSAGHKKQNTNKSMKFAADVVQYVEQADKFFPPQNEDYAVFGRDVLAPMDGTVVRAVNDIDDNIPYSGGYPYNTGNTVVIKKDDYYFLLGHLKKESVTVKEGDKVSKGTVIGKAGNSGRTERPHLHMQLMKSETDKFWSGAGINITFKGKNLYKNRTVYIAE
jgi:biotin carboxyl carrier protein